MQRNVIASVRLSIRPSVRFYIVYPLNRLTFDLYLLHVHGLLPGTEGQDQRSKVKVTDRNADFERAQL